MQKIVIAFVFLFLGTTFLYSQSKEKPNVLFIIADQLSYDMMSNMGNTWLKTPNMDKIAKMGYKFEKAYCVNPVCTPSRFSLLTGHYASEVGAKENTNENVYQAEKVSKIIATDALGTILRKSGYETLYSGKVHLYGSKDVSEYGFKINDTDPYDGPAIYAEKILSEWSKEKSGKPFALFLSFLNPHDICYKAGADKRYPEKLSPENARETARLLAFQKTLSSEEYRKQVPPRATNATPINGENPDMVSMDVGSRKWDDAQWDLNNWMYLRLIESVDFQIGRAITALEKSGLLENTIVIFTSDHGDMHGAHGLTLKNVMFEECQRIPFIFAGKGIKAAVSDKTTLVCNGLDFLPTICDLIGVDAPKDLPGISLKPYLNASKNKPQRKFIITESYNSYQINDGRYKYTVYELPNNPELLTDILVNPGETINYSRDPKYLKILSQLKKSLMTNLSSRGLTPLPTNRTIEELNILENGVKKKGSGKKEE